MRKYKYIGSPDHFALVGKSSTRKLIETPADVLLWTKQTNQVPTSDDEVIATFVIDPYGKLWVADRRSEHLVCADGGEVLAAGEMTFRISGNSIEVLEATNQSTGFCPEPSSWTAVARALDTVCLPHPSEFTASFVFRRCEICETTNIIKDDYIFCAVCNGELAKNCNYEANCDAKTHPTNQ